MPKKELGITIVIKVFNFHLELHFYHKKKEI